MKSGRIRERMESELLELDGVSGVSHRNDEIILYVESEEHAEAMPTVLAGVPVRTVVVGRIYIVPEVRPITGEKYRRSRVRPVVGGISLGDITVTAGTLGIISFDGFLLTNAHVIAINWRKKDWNEIGTPILQPAPYDGGDMDDVIGKLVDFEKIKINDVNADNHIDAAVGSVDVDNIKMSILRDRNEIVNVSGVADVNVGDVVYKSGRTTGWTRNVVIDTNATVKVRGYFSRRNFAVFRDVFLVKQPFASGGDSGSAVIKDGKFAGLLFAGSWRISVVCKAKYIVRRFKVNLSEVKPTRPTKLALAIPVALAGLGCVTMLGGGRSGKKVNSHF